MNVVWLPIQNYRLLTALRLLNGHIMGFQLKTITFIPYEILNIINIYCAYANAQIVMSISTVGTKGQSLGSGGGAGTLGEWKSLYETEKRNYDSAALYAEVRCR